jgi:hypothetical protein
MPAWIFLNNFFEEAGKIFSWIKKSSTIPQPGIPATDTRVR